MMTPLTAAQRPTRAKRETEARIVEAAERLFGLHGLEAVSLRQIAAAAGSSNNVVVQYHFGDKLGLVRAIFERRLPSLELRSGELLARAKRDGKLEDTRTLVEVLLSPLADERDEFGRRSYAAFLDGLYHFQGSFDLRRESSGMAPIASLASEMLQASLPHLPFGLYHRRMAKASAGFHRTIVDLDREQETGVQPLLSEAESLRDALDVVTAALTAPVAKSVLAEIAEAKTKV